MTEAALTPQRPPLAMMGDASAESCDGDVCIIPAHPEHGIVSRRLDDDRV